MFCCFFFFFFGFFVAEKSFLCLVLVLVCSFMCTMSWDFFLSRFQP